MDRFTVEDVRLVIKSAIKEFPALAMYENLLTNSMVCSMLANAVHGVPRDEVVERVKKILEVYNARK
jgi:hypothetical protein